MEGTVLSDSPQYSSKLLIYLNYVIYASFDADTYIHGGTYLERKI